MTATLDSTLTSASAFGHRLAPSGDPLEGEAFEAVYDAKIKPELVKCEADRRNGVLAFFLSLLAGAMLVLLEFMLTSSFTGGMAHTPPGWLIILTVVAAFVIGYLPLAKVAKQAKTAVIQALCEPLGIAYRVAGGEPASFANFLRLHLLPNPTSKTTQDFFDGQRGDISFSICQATLTQGSGKNRRTVFQGQLFRLSMPRSCASTTVLLRNSGWLNRFECPTGLDKVGLEDPVFNKAFAVFGSDQVEAREILTPSFMQQLNDLETAYGGGHIRCAFDHAELLIAVEGKMRFGIGGMFSTLVERSRVEGIARDIEQVFKMIDEFKAA